MRHAALVTIWATAIVLIWVNVAQSQPALLSGNVDGTPHRLVEIHAKPEVPAGFTVLGQEWLVLDDAVDWRQYDNGSVFVATAPPGTYQARWRCQFIKITPDVVGKTEWRVYTIVIRGPPDVVKEPDEVAPNPTQPRLVGIIYETSTTPLSTVAKTAAAKLRALGHQVRVIDRDQETGTGQTPKELIPLLEAAKDRSGVSLVVYSGGKARVLALPDTEAGIIAEATK